MMIEEVILNGLKEALDVPVLMELPEVPSTEYPTFPEEMVLIERVGGNRANQIDHASIAFQSYSTQSLYNAASLDDAVKTAVFDLVALPEISGVRLASNYNHTDTRTKRYRYQCVFEIYY